MSRNFSSTCKSKLDHIRNRMNCSDYQELPQSESKVQEISKPVKIAQLFGLSKKLHIGPRDSAVKISQPERITPYMRNTSTQKKNKANMIHQFHHNERNVRRNLKFTETPTARRTKQFARASTSNLHNKSTMNEERLQTYSRKSFILPPNSIKNLHIAQNKFKQTRSMFPHLNQTRILTEKSVSKYPRISEESSSFLVEDGSVNSPVMHEKNSKISVIQHTSSQTFKVNDRSDANILCFLSSHSNANNNAVEEAIRKHSNIIKASNINVCSNQNSADNVIIDKPQVSSRQNIKQDVKKDVNLYSDNYLNLETNTLCTPGIEKITHEDTYISLRPIKKISASCVDLQDEIDDDREYVTLNKRELTSLISNLKSHLNLICRLEENISYLKLTSTNIINLLSAKNVNKTTNDNEIVESKKQMTENFDDNSKIINNAGTISSPNVQVIEVDCSSASASKTFGSDALACSKTNMPEATENHVETQLSRQANFTPVNNKENEEDTSSSVKYCKSRTRRRSARLMAKALKNSSADNDSFVNLERELNIASKELVTPIVSRMDHTPSTSGRKDKKTGRPWKEYMAMKSRMSCLLTPNIKQFNSTKSKNNMHPESGTSLSSKILADLHNLYSDSPDL